MERGQFTFYRSFYEALSTIDDDVLRAKAYDILAEYALNNKLPDPDQLTGAVKMAFILIRPVLDTGRNKAANRINKTKTNQKQTEKKKESKSKKEYESERKKECEKDSYLSADADFERFWCVYPKQIGKEEARKEFAGVTEPVQTLIDAIEQQKEASQWKIEAGRYIPNPATWLRNKRWEDQTQPIIGYNLSEHERQAIAQIMANKTTPTS